MPKSASCGAYFLVAAPKQFMLESIKISRLGCSGTHTDDDESGSGEAKGSSP